MSVSRCPRSPGRHIVAFSTVLLLTAVPSRAEQAPEGSSGSRARLEGKSEMRGAIRIAYLHHSTGANIWAGGVADFIQAWNEAHRTEYRITELVYPATLGGRPRFLRHLGQRYPWANYPYDYWNLWVAHAGKERDRGELNLDDLVKEYDVIVFKHCFPVGRIAADQGPPTVSSEAKTLENYKLQYDAIKARLRQFPEKRFIVWTGAALVEQSTTPEQASRARQFFDWVKGTWDEPGDNIHVWDFNVLQTDGGLYFKNEYAASKGDSHPNPAFSRTVAPLIGRRIVDVIEGRGDTGSITGR
jgi:hypothetical protein